MERINYFLWKGYEGGGVPLHGIKMIIIFVIIPLPKNIFWSTFLFSPMGSFNGKPWVNLECGSAQRSLFITVISIYKCPWCGLFWINIGLDWIFTLQISDWLEIKSFPLVKVITECKMCHHYLLCLFRDYRVQCWIEGNQLDQNRPYLICLTKILCMPW